MAGICGWFGAGPTIATASIEAMSRALCTPLTGDVICRTAANCALAVVPPHWESDRLYQSQTLWVACQGAAYFNDSSLRKLAADHGIAAAIADGYRRKDVACLEDIGGSFSIAIFDFDQRRMLVAIDRLGIRPLCLAQTATGIVFGATADSVTAHPAVARRIDPQSIYNYLYFHMIPSPRTVYSGMEKLLPGQYALLENGNLQKRFYWQMEYLDQDGLPQTRLADEFRGLLRQGVRRATDHPDIKTGNFLSGGTDSSTLAGIVTEITGAPADTYSIGFDAEGFDESRFADIAVKHFGTHHHNYYVTPQDVVDAIPLIARAYDEPFGNASAVPTFYCARMAKEDGVDLMIAGDGGDELFGGNARYVKQKTFEFYSRLPAPLRHALIEPVALHLPGAQNLPLLSKLRSYIAQAKIPLPDRLESYNFLHRTPLCDIFQESFLEEVNIEEPLNNIREVYQRTHANSTLHRMLHLDMKNTLADNDLRKVNIMCEIAGLGVSYPLLDDAMVEFSGRVPPNLKIKGFALRFFFKNSLKDFLPPEIIKKSKHGFGLPFGLWLNQYAPLRKLVDDSLQSLRCRQYINPSYIDTLLNEQHRQHATYYGTMIWVLVMLEQWLQNHGGDI